MPNTSTAPAPTAAPQTAPQSTDPKTKTPQPKPAKPVEQKKPALDSKQDPGLTTNDGQQQSAPAATPAETKPFQQGEQALRKLKLKIDGQEQEFPEHEVIARAQKAAAADKRFQEAMTARQQAEALVNLLKSDFTKLIDDPRLNIPEEQKRKMMEEWYKRKYIDPEILTPEQKKQREMEMELQRYREQEANNKKQAEQKAIKDLEDYHRENYQKVIIGALQTEGIPKTEFTVKRMADLMAKNLQMGLDLTPEHLATLVREDYMNEIKALFGASDGETLMKLVGDDFTNKIRRADLERLRAGQPQVPKPIIETPKADQSAATPSRPYRTMDEERQLREQRARELQSQWKKR